MLIQKSAITVKYKRIDGIKRIYYNNEKIFKNYFNEATVLPVPDDAPTEIPRIIIKTLHDHAQLNISPEATTFEVFYDEGFERDWTKCSQYIEARMESVFAFLNLLTDNNYEYIGVVSYILFDEIEKDGTAILAERLLKSEKIKHIYDINIRYTFTEKENIFVNITLQNARLYKSDISTDIAGELNKDNLLAESIGAIVDINDRYGFNDDVNYQSSAKNLTVLLQNMDNVINNKLTDLIKKGEY